MIDSRLGSVVDRLREFSSWRFRFRFIGASVMSFGLVSEIPLEKDVKLVIVTSQVFNIDDVIRHA